MLYVKCPRAPVVVSATDEVSFLYALAKHSDIKEAGGTIRQRRDTLVSLSEIFTVTERDDSGVNHSLAPRVIAFHVSKDISVISQ